MKLKMFVFSLDQAQGKETSIQKPQKNLLGKLTDNNFGIVYGGGSNGLMGILGDSAINAGGYITGIITEQLDDIEVGHQGLNELIIVKNMHERKK